MPSLARAFGYPEAGLLQQIHYWMLAVSYGKGPDDIHYRDGRWWIWNSYPEWQKQMDWWSEMTIRRMIGRLRDSGVVITTQHPSGLDRSLWYSIDYDRLEEILDEQEASREAKMRADASEAQDAPVQSEQAHASQENRRTDKKVNRCTYAEPTSEPTPKGGAGSALSQTRRDDLSDDDDDADKYRALIF